MNYQTSILITDEDPGAAHVTACALEMQGYQVWLAHSWRQILRSGAYCLFDIAVIDMDMPDMNWADGIYTAANIDKNTRLILTTKSAEGHWLAEEAGKMGVGSILHKPYNLDELIVAMDLPGYRYYALTRQ